jgi:hypothetical protein
MPETPRSTRDVHDLEHALQGVAVLLGVQLGDLADASSVASRGLQVHRTPNRPTPIMPSVSWEMEVVTEHSGWTA